MDLILTTICSLAHIGATRAHAVRNFGIQVGVKLAEAIHLRCARHNGAEASSYECHTPQLCSLNRQL